MMDERESKRDFIDLIRRIVELAQPNLRSFYRMTRKAKIVGVYAADGQYFADVQPLRNDESVDDSEPVVPRVALPVLWGGPDRGVVCPPAKGTLCDLSFYDGDPNYPFISNIRYGLGQNAPKADLNELVIQLEPGVEIRIDKEKQVVTLTSSNWKVNVGGNAEVTAGGDATVQAGGTLTLKAPEIIKEGNETARGTGGGLGTVHERDHREHEGSYSLRGPANITGAVVIDGPLTVTGGINGKVNGCSGCG
ncbi:baseplate assembly protein [Desulfovibrio sp. ZJ200]|uniref:baseplate assembly protein n=1 Tax=Desulfovibrio sp. ZJ200 TaxID=2709792 RepID=UPI001F14AF47|nr:baseplate assembly protein [Desulfovibrio sp. ZJ200]